jgi:uncharacterized protein (DUF1015 family)
MALIVPFRALRPAPPSAGRVAAVPYDVVSTDEARSLAAGNPLSFLHVSRAEIDLPGDTNPYDEAVYAKAIENFEALKAAAPLVTDDRASLYVYRLRMGAHEQAGVASCFSLAEYGRDIIKKHERTRQDKEDDRTRHMLALRAQTGPVLLTYRVSAAIDAVVSKTMAGESPLCDFTADDDVQHTIWPIAPSEERGLIAAFDRIPALYIADGHHRAASAARVRTQLRGPSGAAGEWDTVLAVAFPDTQMQILPYNRAVKDLGMFTPETLLAKLREQFTVQPGTATPRRRGEVAMFLDGRWYTIALGDAAANLPPDRRLDVSQLQERILSGVLGIGDVRTDKRIDFVGGARGIGKLEQQVRSGEAAVAFSLHPVSVDDLMQISDAGGIMPPKSTWFEPKLRDGLLSHVI